jgi:hypothetical protein
VGRRLFTTSRCQRSVVVSPSVRRVATYVNRIATSLLSYCKWSGVGERHNEEKGRHMSYFTVHALSISIRSLRRFSAEKKM